MTWFVVQTQPRKEVLAGEHLARQGFEVYLPRCRKTVRHARRTTTAVAPLFPRYLFVGFDPALARWRAINSTFGVSHLVSEGDRPLPVPPGVVEELIERGDDGGVIEVAPVSFDPGAPLEIVSGTLASQVGRFLSLDERQRVVLLIELLHRPVRVAVPVESVRPLD